MTTTFDQPDCIIIVLLKFANCFGICFTRAMWPVVFIFLFWPNLYGLKWKSYLPEYLNRRCFNILTRSGSFPTGMQKIGFMLPILFTQWTTDSHTCTKTKSQDRWCRWKQGGTITTKTRNIVSNAHKMIPSAPPCFVFAYFTVGNLKIDEFKMYNRMWGMSSSNI